MMPELKKKKDLQQDAGVNASDQTVRPPSLSLFLRTQYPSCPVLITHGARPAFAIE